MSSHSYFPWNHFWPSGITVNIPLSSLSAALKLLMLLGHYCEIIQPILNGLEDRTMATCSLRSKALKLCDEVLNSDQRSFLSLLLRQHFSNKRKATASEQHHLYLGQHSESAAYAPFRMTGNSEFSNSEHPTSQIRAKSEINRINTHCNMSTWFWLGLNLFLKS